MRKLEIDEWVVRLMKVVHDGANSRVTVNACFSKRFDVTVGVHQGSVLSPLRFAIVMEALSIVSVVLVTLGSSSMGMIWSS